MLTAPSTRRVAVTTARFAVLPLACLSSVALGTPPAAHADSSFRTFAHDFAAVTTISSGKGVTVAVLDSGVDPKALDGAVLPGRDLVGLPAPKRLWGTLTANVIAGTGAFSLKNPVLPGLAPDVKILPVRVVPDREPGAEHWYQFTDVADVIARGIRYAVDHGAGVILVGEGAYSSDTRPMEEAVDYARTKNAVVVVATGDRLPTSLPGVIGVTAAEWNRGPSARYSPRSSTTLVAAPGRRLTYAGPGGKRYDVWGSRPAAAFVAATAALVKSRYPTLTSAQIAQAISDSAHHPKGGYDPGVGFGVINPAGALATAESLARHPPSATATRGVVSAGAHFGAVPEEISAVPRNTGLFAAFVSLIAAGAGALVAATLLFTRGRRRTGDTRRGERTGAAAGDDPATAARCG